MDSWVNDWEVYGACLRSHELTQDHLLEATFRSRTRGYNRDRWKRIAELLEARLRSRLVDVKLAERALHIGGTTAGVPLSSQDFAAA